MKRYLVFAGSNYYPVGGWEDFKCDHDTLEAATAAAWAAGEDWQHVVDLEEGKQIDLFRDKPPAPPQRYCPMEGLKGDAAINPPLVKPPSKSTA
jgi:hypothetical protein